MLDFIKATGRAAITVAEGALPWVKNALAHSNSLEALQSSIPKEMTAFNRRGRETVRNLLKEGKLTEITSAHPEEALAAIGRRFEEAMEHRVVKKFRRNRLRLLLDHEGVVLGDGIAPVIAADKNIVIPKAMAINQPPEQIADFVNHEIGHHLAADLTGRRFRLPLPRVTKKAEKLADQVAVALSPTKGAELKNALDHLLAHEPSEQQLLEMSRLPWHRKLTIKFNEFANGRTNIFQYPTTPERIALIDETAAKLATPEGRSHVEAELERRLKTEHRKFFPHLYKREIPNTRA